MFSDDLSALVFNGNHLNSFIGYAGDEAPSFSSSSFFARRASDSSAVFFEGAASLARGESTEWNPLLSRGSVADMEVYGQYLSQMAGRIGCNLADYPLCLTTQDSVTGYGSDRLGLAGLMFEGSGSPALFFVSRALATICGTGRVSGVLVDSGETATEVHAIFDGYILKRHSKKLDFSGAKVSGLLEAELCEKLEGRDPGLPGLRPGSDRRLETLDRFHPNFEQFLTAQAIRGLKENSLVDLQAEEKPALSLPDGSAVEFDCLVDASRPLFERKIGDSTLADLPNALVALLNEVAIDSRKTLISNFVLTGGNSLLPRFQKNLENSLAENPSMHAKPKLNFPSKLIEKKMPGWLGASIMSSVEAFQNMWVSRFEYLENGENIILRKCIN